MPIYLKLLFIALFIPAGHAQSSLTFSDFWKEIKENNPALKQQQSTIESIKNDPALMLPMPELSISEMNESLPFASSMKMQRSIELSQDVPFISKFKKANELKESNIQLADEKKALLAKTMKEEAFDVFMLYAKNLEMKKLMTEKEGAFLAHQSRSRSIRIVEQTDQTYLFDLDVEINMIRTELKMLDIELAMNKAKMLRLMGKESTELHNVEAGALLPPEATYSSETLSDHPMQKMNRFEIDVMSRELEMAKLDWAPDLMLKLKNIKSYDSMVPGGKEIMVGISMPFLFPWQRTAKIDSIAHLKKAEEYRAMQIKNELSEEYSSMVTQVKEQWNLINIYKERSLPAVNKKMKIARNFTRMDMDSLMFFEKSVDQLFSLKQKIIEEEYKYRKAYFKINELLTNEGIY